MEPEISPARLPGCARTGRAGSEGAVTAAGAAMQHDHDDDDLIGSMLLIGGWTMARIWPGCSSASMACLHVAGYLGAYDGAWPGCRHAVSTCHVATQRER